PRRGRDRRSQALRRRPLRSQASAADRERAVRPAIWPLPSYPEMKVTHAPKHRGVVLSRHWRHARHPRQQIALDRLEQMLVLVEFGVVETLDMDVGEAAHDQIRLPRAAMPGPEQQTPPAGVEAVARSGAAGHELSNAKNPAGAGCGIYI